MKKNLKILAITFSVALNIVFIGSYFYHGSGLLTLAGRQGEHDHPLYEDLGLGRDQLDRFKPIRDSFHAFVNEQGRKIKTKQLELVDLLAGVKPDRRAIDTKQEEILTLQRQMQARVIDHLLEESNLFTPGQRVKFFALIRERIEKSSGPRPGWMPKRRENPSKGKRP
ncbi:MAG: periplasmic heavy metal sensor [Deltaproteobacteria bacterium]|nr:periplasmic heavy metal sensor [Deltaproteobacteria bacterium]